jgi:hypothetical protein
MNVTNGQLLALRDAVRRKDMEAAATITETIRRENPSACAERSDLALQRELLLRAASLLMNA